MGLRSLAIAYLLGGLTFIPLLVATVVTIAWYASPRTEDKEGENGVRGVGAEIERGRERGVSSNAPSPQEDNVVGDAAASGTFAVLRSYNFSAALSALNSRNSITGGGNSGAGGGLTDGSTELGGSSESVYQSMYRSVFDRNNKNAIVNVVLRSSEDDKAGPDDDGRGKKKAAVVGASVFYIVLRHGHLMLYDSPAQVEVRHVISLGHHTISLSDGSSRSNGGSGDDDEVLQDGELFVKRTAIVLTPIDQAPDGHSSHTVRGRGSTRPFYLFSSTCSEKEDFYHALLTTRTPPPVPQPLAAEDLIKLQSTLHSSTLTPETRALNALLGRIFLSLHRTKYLETLIRRKIERKITRVQKPAFLASLAVDSLDLGDAAPVLSQLRLKDLDLSGDTTIAFTLRYTGGMRVVLTAVARLDLGYSRLKPRTLSLVLATTLQRLHAQVLVRVKPPPSNRIWFCFDSMPEMDVQVAPVVSQRQITYAFILRAIEERIRTVVGETLVKPNWDDLPFFDTRGQKVRGGIWKDEGDGELVRDEREGEGVHSHADIDWKDRISLLGERNAKTMSMPTLAGGAVGATETGDSSSSGSESTTARTSAVTTEVSLLQEQNTALKRRSVASLPLSGQLTGTGDQDHEGAPHPPPLPRRPLRSPSFTSPSPAAPSVTLNDTSVGSVKADGASYQQPHRKSTWRSRASLQGPSGRKEAVEGLREMRDRDIERKLAQGRVSSASSPATSIDNGTVIMEPGGQTNETYAESEDLELANEDDIITSARTSSDSRTVTSSRSPSLREQIKSPLQADSSASSIRSSRPSQSSQGPRSKALFAATAAATTAAKNWGWNALANRKINTGSGPSPRYPHDGVTAATASRAAAHHHSGIGNGRGVDSVVKEPIGRGQPLPPPGVPLPRPAGQQKTLWQAAANGLGGMGRGMGMGIRRKPVPSGFPVRTVRPLAGEEREGENDRVQFENFNGLPEDEKAQKVLGEPIGEAEDEFGPWRENSGLEEEVERLGKGEMGSAHSFAGLADVDPNENYGENDAEQADDMEASLAPGFGLSAGEDEAVGEQGELVASSTGETGQVSHMNIRGEAQDEEDARPSSATSSAALSATRRSGSQEIERIPAKKVPSPHPPQRQDMLKAVPVATATTAGNTGEEPQNDVVQDHVQHIGGESEEDGVVDEVNGERNALTVSSSLELRHPDTMKIMPAINVSEEMNSYPLSDNEFHLDQELSAPGAVAAVSPVPAYPEYAGDDFNSPSRSAEVGSLDDGDGQGEKVASAATVAEQISVEREDVGGANSKDEKECHGVGKRTAQGEEVDSAVP